MSAFQFIWDAAQDGQIQNQAEQIEEMKEKINIMAGWIGELKQEIETLKTRLDDDGK